MSSYISYLLSTPVGSSCVKASEVLEVSHDVVNRFLLSGDYSGYELFESIKPHIDLRDGVLSVDDTILDKPYSSSESTELIGYFWSGKHHQTVKGISLIVLLYSKINGESYPINFRVYRHSDGLSKNDYFQQMVKEVWSWGLRPAWVSADSWYSSLENLKFLRNLEVHIWMGLEKNRQVSLQPHQLQAVNNFDIPEDGLWAHLKGFDFIQIFQTVDKAGEVRYYLMYQTQKESDNIHLFKQHDFEQVKQHHWRIEMFFRYFKQCCQAEKFFVRNTQAIKNHLFAALRAAQVLVGMVNVQLIRSVYGFKRMIFLQSQIRFVKDFA